MRLKHNKKRNTAFLFEALTREYVKSIIRNNVNRQGTIKNIIKKHFCNGALNEELSIYRELLESKNLTSKEAESVLSEAKVRYTQLNKKEIFSKQNILIKEINHTLSSSVFSNFIPNYKDIATIYNIFNNKTTMKEKILLEQRIVENLSSETDNDSKVHIDNLTYKTFVDKFNNKYADLPEEQKNLLTNYIASFSDNGLSLKHYLNEKVGELKEKMSNLKETPETQNEEIKQKFNKIIEKLDSYKDREVDDVVVSEVLMMQQLVREIDNA